jgi:hypothetical protein
MKSNLLKILAALGFVIATLLWVLATVIKDVPYWFNFAFAVFVLTLIWGGVLIVGGLGQERASVKKAFFVGGGALIVFSAFMAVVAFALPVITWLPIVFLALAVVVFVAVLLMGGDKWDKGDNEQPGYKTYRQKLEEKETAKNNAEKE